MFTVQEKSDMVEMFIQCRKNARISLTEYRIRFPNRVYPHFTYFQKLYAAFKNTGTVTKVKKRTGTITEQEVNNVLELFRENPYLSLRECSERLTLTIYRIRKILAQNNFKPFKVKPVQTLELNDPIRRLRFCRWYLQEINDASRENILWTDESNFGNTKKFNRKNVNYWSVTNDHVIRDINQQRRFSINVWCGILHNKIVGPYFYEGTLTGVRYLQFLQYELPVLLENVPLNVRAQLILQQDGAPPHNTQEIRNFLNDNFHIWIGNTGSVLWPARSPDLSPLDFYLWGAMKDFVYKTNPANIEEVKVRVRQFIEHENNKDIDIMQQILKRVEKCVQLNGEHFEQYF